MSGVVEKYIGDVHRAIYRGKQYSEVLAIATAMGQCFCRGCPVFLHPVIILVSGIRQGMYESMGIHYFQIDVR